MCANTLPPQIFTQTKKHSYVCNDITPPHVQTKKHEASQSGRKSVKKRSALDITGLTTIGGNSALALAVRHGHANVVDYLLSQGECACGWV